MKWRVAVMHLRDDQLSAVRDRFSISSVFKNFYIAIFILEHGYIKTPQNMTALNVTENWVHLLLDELSIFQYWKKALVCRWIILRTAQFCSCHESFFQRDDIVKFTNVMERSVLNHSWSFSPPRKKQWFYDFAWGLDDVIIWRHDVILLLRIELRIALLFMKREARSKDAFTAGSRNLGEVKQLCGRMWQTKPVNAPQFWSLELAYFWIEGLKYVLLWTQARNPVGYTTSSENFICDSAEHCSSLQLWSSVQMLVRYCNLRECFASLSQVIGNFLQ